MSHPDERGAQGHISKPKAGICRKTALPISAFLIASLIAVVIWPTVTVLKEEQPLPLIGFLLLFRLNALFLLFHIFGYWLYRCIGGIYSEKAESAKARITRQPHVSILVPIRDEPVNLVRRMLLHLRAVRYDNYSVVLINNGGMPTKRQFNELLADTKLHATLIQKKDSTGHKGGALNAGLKAIPKDSEYVLVLDVDQAPRPLILQSLVPILEQDNRLAFVQAPQRFANSTNSLISTAYCFKLRVFYDHLCNGMAATGSLFFSGTNALFRKTALDEVGGFDERSLTEDIRTSIQLHRRGWLGEYYSDAVAVGYAPFDLYSYYRQQRRWAIGTFQNYIYTLRLFFTRPTSLSFEQWIMYLGWNGTFYLQSLTCVFFLLSSIVFLRADLTRWMRFTDGIALAASLLTVIAIAASQRRATHSSIATLLISYVIFFGDFIVHLRALSELLFRKKLDFEVTSKEAKTSRQIPLANLYSHVFLVLCVIVAIAVTPSSGRSEWRIVWPFLFILQSLGVILVIVIEALQDKSRQSRWLRQRSRQQEGVLR
jgi:cellulose synthase/poly-beta-1,6-N-acetylglucosamine synthase-like glycosyltransferase